MKKDNKTEEDSTLLKNFIQKIIEDDIAKGKNNGKVITRFPPEPNGYLHIGHAKSICLNFGLAKQYSGITHLRFDDTNPEKEDTEYTESIKEDVKWLGFDWGDKIFYASDYFEKLYNFAVVLIKKELAYVDTLAPEKIREYRGTLTEPGKESPDRSRPIDESLSLFEKMRAGEFKEGECVLRAKIDMASPNINMRDPILYRIKFAVHHRTGDKWCIYPMYDFAHALSDAIEGITHSICTLEFEDHRPLYDWCVRETEAPCRPQQIEFARLNLTYMIMSKRKLLRLVKEGFVSGWDDPRMPTISGLRRRGYTPEAIQEFAARIGIAKSASIVDYALLEFCLREDLNRRAYRKMVVLNPLKVIIRNYPEDQTELLDGENNPEDETAGIRQIPFSRELYIEKEDFMIDPPKKYFRLSPGKEVRLKHAYYITCVEYKTDSSGNVIEVICDYDPKSRGGWTDDGRKVKGTSHWVSASHGVNVEVRLYGNLFVNAEPEAGGDFTENINNESLTVLKNAIAEPSLTEDIGTVADNSIRYQFLRQGYFCFDSKDGTREKPVFNRTVTLKDSYGKISSTSQKS